MRLVAKHLPTAVHDPKNLEARSGMLAASMMGAAAFQKGLGVCHSAAHALSTVYDTHHGLANALMLEACMEFNAPVVPEKMALLGQAVGVRALDDKALGKGFIKWIQALKKEVGIPAGLKAQGVKDIAKLLDIAVADPCHPSNPKPVTKADFEKLFRSSM